MRDTPKAKKLGKLRAFVVSAKDNSDKQALVFANSHAHAKSLSKTHFAGAGYKALRALRGGVEQFDQYAKTKKLVQSNDELPAGAPNFYPEPTHGPAVSALLAKAKAPAPVEFLPTEVTDESLVLPEIKTEKTEIVRTHIPVNAKKQGFFGKIITRLFGA